MAEPKIPIVANADNYKITAFIIATAYDTTSSRSYSI